jgi:hypothetical protein
MKKSELLFAANYRYNVDRDLYVNRETKKAFSLEFVDDNSEETVRRAIQEATDGKTWHFYFNDKPSEGVQRMIEEDLEAA